MATDFAQCSHHTRPFQEMLVINRRKTGMIGHNVGFPLLPERQRWRFLYLLQQAVDKSRQFSESVITIICCSGRVNEIISNWNRNMCCRQGDIDCAHQNLTTMYLVYPKTNMESGWNNTNDYPRGDQRHPPGRETNSWAYLQISRRRCSRRNFMRAIWSM